jgi:aspartate-semialdehyde dehydrogenase
VKPERGLARPRVALVGATGAVGEALLDLLQARRFPLASLTLAASDRSRGRSIAWGGAEHPVLPLREVDFSQVDLAFFSAGTAVSRDWAVGAARAGALVIDNTNAFRMADQVPLVVPQVNGHLLQQRPKSGIIANPNCSTIQLVRILAPLRQQFGIRRVVVSTYQAASGGGKTGIAELLAGSREHLEDRAAAPPARFPRPLAFNVVPQVDVLLDSGFTLEEQKMVQESRKILEAPELALTATAVRVPVINGHSEAVYVQCESPLERAAVFRTLRQAPEVELYGESDAGSYPTPRFLDDPRRVHVGRIRLDPDDPRGLWLWIVADNLLIGAALNALQIAERLAEVAR